jgi:hypothetical protein
VLTSSAYYTPVGCLREYLAVRALEAGVARGEITREEYLDLRRVLESEHGDVGTGRIEGVR